MPNLPEKGIFVPGAEIVLEYLKVILTAPVIFGVVSLGVLLYFGKDIKALIRRIAKIKFGSGVEFSTPQSNRLAEEEAEREPPDPPEEPIQGLPLGLTQEQHQAVEQIIRSHIVNAHLWEYRYLNYFLAPSTQYALDWLAGFNQPITYAQYDTFWLVIIASAEERQAMINALQAHHLIVHDTQLNTLAVTPKGHEYRAWRGDMPPLRQQED